MTKVGRLYRESLVEQVKDGVTNSDNVFLLTYSQVSGLQMNDLRKSLKGAGASMRTTRNSVVRRAMREMEHEALSEKVAGQTALVWGGNDSAEISKLLVKFMEEADNVAIQGGLLQGKILGKDDVKKLSELPSREVLLSMLLAAIQSPLTRLAGAMNAKTRDLMSILKQLSEKKGEGGS